MNQTTTKAEPRQADRIEGPKTETTQKRTTGPWASNSGTDLDGDDAEGRRCSSHHHQMKLHREVELKNIFKHKLSLPLSKYSVRYLSIGYPKNTLPL
jgi:hypothetical protein